MADTHFYGMTDRWTTISGDPIDRHTFQPAHDINIAEVNLTIDGAPRKYLAYDCDPNGTKFRFYYTDNLDGQWTEYSGNPILDGRAVTEYRWPSVAWNGTALHMSLCDNAHTVLERWTSTNGTGFTYQEDITTVNGTAYMNPFIWKDPNDSKWCLYYKIHGTPRELYIKTADTIEGLTSASSTKVMDDNDASPGTVAAASVFYKDGKYWLLTEYQDGGVWKISAFYSDSRDSGFTYAKDILLLNEACPIALGSPEGSDVYLYVSRDDGIYWRADSRKLFVDNK